jgi:FkbM family methyltransferase
MPMISYAQNGEDVLLRRLFAPDHRGFYIDAGANDPVYHSVTKHFYEHGWSGVNVEPIPEMHARLRADRPRDVNLHMGLADREGSMPFFESADIHGWSTFAPDLAAEYRRRGHRMIEHAIPVTTLASVCERFAVRPIDFLKIDVEGFEACVLRGGDWDKYRPRVVLIENAWPETWEPLILGAGYLLAACDGINRYYVRQEEPALLEPFRTPVNVCDDYIPYGYHRIIGDLQEQVTRLGAELAVYHQMGSFALGVARRVRDIQHGHPRLARVVKRIVRRAG